jgi:hypothetical protein
MYLQFPQMVRQMITLFLDESGTHTKNHVVVAGFAGKKRHWQKFADERTTGLGDRPFLQRFEFNFEDSPLNFYTDKMMQMMSCFRGLKRHDGNSQIARWAFIAKDQSSLFQPADYLANHIYNKMTNPESRRTLWTAPICKEQKLIGAAFPRDTARRLFAYLQSDEYTKNVSRKYIKEYRKGVRERSIPDPWKNLDGFLGDL